MKSRTLFAAALATGALAASLAGAQSAPRPRLRLICSSEIHQFCPGTRGRVTMQCIRAHLRAASPQCLAAVQEDRTINQQNRAAMAGAPPPQ